MNQSRAAEPGRAAADHAARAYRAASVAPECVRLQLDGLGAVDAFVTRAVAGAAELLFAAPPPVPARVLHRRTARLSPVPPAGADELRVTLRVLPDAAGGLRPDAVLALWDAAPGASSPAPAPPPVPAANRRAAVRLALHRPVTIVRPGDHTGVPARTEDLSAGGLAVAGGPVLTRGDVVRLRLLLDGGRPLEAVGEVRRRAGGGRHGLRLVQLRPQDRLWLERWLAAHREPAKIFPSLA